MCLNVLSFPTLHFVFSLHSEKVAWGDDSLARETLGHNFLILVFFTVQMRKVRTRDTLGHICLVQSSDEKGSDGREFNDGSLRWFCLMFFPSPLLVVVGKIFLVRFRLESCQIDVLLLQYWTDWGGFQRHILSVLKNCSWKMNFQSECLIGNLKPVTILLSVCFVHIMSPFDNYP